jgi:glycine hydroxymethyltransferase
MSLKKYSKIYSLLKAEESRQLETINLIPSENYPSKAVLEATASILTSKYSEGYPGKRYYPGNKIYDQIELLAQKRAKEIFKTGDSYHVNVQSYSGTPANLAVYLALLNFGDRIMGMNLAHGGHLSHGHSVNFSGRAYKVVQYGVDLKTGKIDYEEVRKLAKKYRPKIIISGATAYPRKINFKKFHQIAREVKAISMADIAHIAGLIAAGLHPSPFPFTDIVTTTTQKTLRGPRGAIIFCKEKFAKDIDRAVFPGIQGGPHNNIILAKLVCFEEAKKPAFKKYQKQVLKNAKVLAEELKKYGFNLVSGGTDNHLILIDLRNKNITGKEAEERLEKAGIIANRNTIPGDPRKPFDPSGIRLGTPAMTTRGMKEKEMKKIAEWIFRVTNNSKEVKKVGKEVRLFSRKYGL